MTASMTMTIFAWSAALLVIVLLIAVIVALIRLLAPKFGIGRGRAFSILVVLLAAFGGIAVAGAAGMLLMHMTMMGCC